MDHEHSLPPGLHRRDLLRRGIAAAGLTAVAPTALRSLVAPGGGGGAVDLSDAVPLATHVAPPPVVTRAEWGADESIRQGSPGFATIQKGVVHHTVTRNDEPSPAARVRAIYEFHVRGNGWSDIGYNFLVDDDGRAYEGRWARAYAPGQVHDGEDGSGRGVIGAHAFNHNTGSVGIALLGTYTSSATTPSAAALATVARLLAWKFGPRDIDPHAAGPYRRGDGQLVSFPNLSGHRDIVVTGCPGDGLYRRLGELRNAVAAQVRRGLLGMRVVGADGSVSGYGVALDIGDLPRQGIRGVPLHRRGADALGDGLWMVGADGAVFSFGDAPFHGSMGGRRLNQPMVGMAATPTGGGYWLVSSDGGIFCFGDARFLGGTGGIRLNQPIVGMAAVPDGAGYWLVSSDGGIFSFGSARFHGSTGGIRLNQPIVGMATSPTGGGYWLVSRDGGIFTFGDAPFLGSLGGRPFAGPARGVAATPSGRGYWILAGDGVLHAFGDAPAFHGSVPVAARPPVALVPIVRP